jgi:hypothetical protein
MPLDWKDAIHTLPGLLMIVGPAIALAAACGLRAFLPLLALSVASHVGAVHLAPAAAWFGSDAALWILGAATVLEVLGDKVPVLDHVLDLAATFVRPAAGAVVAWAAYGHWAPQLAWPAAIIVGSGALGVHLFKAKTRLGSTALTLGHGNPFLSMGEDVLALVLSSMIWVGPLLAGLAIVLAFVFVGWLASRRTPGGGREAAPGR